MPSHKNHHHSFTNTKNEEVEIDLITDEEQGQGTPHHVKMPLEQPPSLFGRFVFLVISWIALCWTGITAAFFTIYGFLTLITAFRNEDFLKRTLSWWARFKGGLAVVVGTFLAVFSPLIGIGVITLYFATREKSLANDAILRMFYDHLQRK